MDEVERVVLVRPILRCVVELELEVGRDPRRLKALVLPIWTRVKVWYLNGRKVRADDFGGGKLVRKVAAHRCQLTSFGYERQSRRTWPRFLFLCRRRAPSAGLLGETDEACCRG